MKRLLGLFYTGLEGRDMVYENPSASLEAKLNALVPPGYSIEIEHSLSHDVLIITLYQLYPSGEGWNVKVKRADMKLSMTQLVWAEDSILPYIVDKLISLSGVKLKQPDYMWEIDYTYVEAAALTNPNMSATITGIEGEWLNDGDSIEVEWSLSDAEEEEYEEEYEEELIDSPIPIIRSKQNAAQ